MCIHTDECQQEVFQISYPPFVWEAKYETLCVCIVGGGETLLNTLFVINILLFVVQFSNCDISIGVSVGRKNTLWPYSLVHGYEFLEEHFGFSFTSCQETGL